MTPQEISDYKRKWLMDSFYFEVKTHTDVRRECKGWCKLNCFKQEWGIENYTGVYQDTFVFHYGEDHTDFKGWYQDAFPWSC